MCASPCVSSLFFERQVGSYQSWDDIVMTLNLIYMYMHACVYMFVFATYIYICAYVGSATSVASDYLRPQGL